MANRIKLTQKKKKIFADQLRDHGGVSRAARTIGMARGYMYEVKASQADFSLEWDEAVAEYVEKLEMEADRRAHDGVEKTIFYQGIVVGEERNYSDTLMIFRLKALRPDIYRENSSVNLTGQLDVGVKYIAGLTEDDI